MNKLLFTAVALIPIAFFSLFASIQAKVSLEDIAQKSMVQVNDNCSGVVVDAELGLVATASHCVKGATNVPVKLEFFEQQEDGSYQTITRYASFIKRNEVTDVAIVKVTGGLRNRIAIVFNTDRPARGTTVFAIGNPMGWEGFITKGIISNNYYVWTKDMFDGIVYHTGLVSYVTDVIIAGGSSGGPLVNEAGELVGLTNWRSDRANLTLITPSKYVLELLEECR